MVTLRECKAMTKDTFLRAEGEVGDDDCYADDDDGGVRVVVLTERDAHTRDCALCATNSVVLIIHILRVKLAVKGWGCCKTASKKWRIISASIVCVCVCVPEMPSVSSSLRQCADGRNRNTRGNDARHSQIRKMEKKRTENN